MPEILRYKDFRDKIYVKKVGENEPTWVYDRNTFSSRVPEGYVRGIMQDCEGNVVYANDLVTIPKYGDKTFQFHWLVTPPWLKVLGGTHGANMMLIEDFHGKCKVVGQQLVEEAWTYSETS
jgi:hypothetical protein